MTACHGRACHARGSRSLATGTALPLPPTLVLPEPPRVLAASDSRQLAVANLAAGGAADLLRRAGRRRAPIPRPALRAALSIVNALCHPPGLPRDDHQAIIEWSGWVTIPPPADGARMIRGGHEDAAGWVTPKTPLKCPSSASESFDLLGFTHVWKQSHFQRWMVGRRTSRSRLSRALGRIRDWCREHRHDPMREQHTMLCQKVRGHYAYFALRGNSEGIARFFREVRGIWHRWL